MATFAGVDSRLKFNELINANGLVEIAFYLVVHKVERKMIPALSAKLFGSSFGFNRHFLTYERLARLCFQQYLIQYC